MRIELLYIEGCPNWRRTLEDTQAVLAQAGVDDAVMLVEVTDRATAGEQHFVGSPTVRVNGVDVDPDAPREGFDVECRIYWVEGRACGTPPHGWIASAVARAKDREMAPSES